MLVLAQGPVGTAGIVPALGAVDLMSYWYTLNWRSRDCFADMFQQLEQNLCEKVRGEELVSQAGMLCLESPLGINADMHASI